MKKLIISLLVVTALAVGADVVAKQLAEGEIGLQLQETAKTTMRPDVDVRGFPFLTQALGGRYDEIRFTAQDVKADSDVKLASFAATLKGVSLDLGDAVGGKVSSVPVEDLSATAVLGFDQLAADRPFRLARDGDLLRVTGEVRVLGRTLTATAISSVTLDGQAVVVTAERYEVGNEAVDDALSAALGGLLDLRLDIGGLPYGLELTGVRVAEGGVALDATAGATVISTG